MRTRLRLLLLVLSVLVPSFLAAALAVAYVYHDARGTQDRAMLDTARAVALLVDNELEKKEELLRVLAGSPSLAAGELADFYEHARRVVPPPESTVILFDLDGRQLLNTRRPYGSPLPTRKGSNLGELGQRNGIDRTLVSDLFMGQVVMRYDYAIQVPVKVDGHIRYLLTMGVNASSLQRLLTRQRVSDTWLASVVDRKGIVVARSRNPEQYIGKAARASTLREIAGRDEAIYDALTLDNVASRSYASTVPDAGWKVLLSIPRSELRAAPLRAAAVLGGLMTLLLVLGLVAARRFANRAIGPIEALGRSAQTLGESGEVHYQSTNWFEIDSVARHLAEASRRIHHAQAEMEARVADAVAATERAQQALLKNQQLEALGRLTGGIAHEYNNLLQTLTTALQLAGFAMRGNDKVQNLLETCKRTVARATALTGQLGSFGRLQAARLTTVDVCAQLKSAIQLMKGSLKSDIAVEVHCAEDLWPVTLEPLQFDVALLNLAANARDAMPDGGTLRVDANNVSLDGTGQLPRGDYVLVTLTDSGSGMTPEVMARALDPFFTTKPPGQGTGLGLPQAYAFAVQAGGTLVLDSIAGIGTRVDLYLARATDDALTVPAASAGPARIKGSGSVLFVEDDALVREAVMHALGESGFEVTVAEDGEAALRLLEAMPRRPDVVFSDVVMPGQVSGVDLAGILMQRYPNLPVVLATGYTEQQIAVPGVQVLAKPYTIEQLVELLSRSTGA
ncbi:response regulator [Telluria sp. B2]